MNSIKEWLPTQRPWCHVNITHSVSQIALHGAQSLQVASSAWLDQHLIAPLYPLVRVLHDVSTHSSNQVPQGHYSTHELDCGVVL
jgi:hypothetical protein